MPSIKNIDKFVQLLNTLGNEPRILQQRGQELEPAVVPDKTPQEENPFLVNIEDDDSLDDVTDVDTPDLLEDLDSLDDDDDDLFGFGDFDLDDSAAPDLEEDDTFDLDSLSDQDLDLDRMDAPDLEEEVTSDISDLEEFEELEELDELDSLEESDILDDLDDDQKALFGTEDSADISGDTESLDEFDSLDDLDLSGDESSEEFGTIDELDLSSDESSEEFGSLDDIDLSSDETTDDFGSFDDLDLKTDETIEELASLDELDLSSDETSDDFGSLDGLDLNTDETIEELGSLDELDLSSDETSDDFGSLDSLDLNADETIEELGSLDELDLSSDETSDNFGSLDSLDLNTDETIEELGSLDELDLSSDETTDDFGSLDELDLSIDESPDDFGALDELGGLEDITEPEELGGLDDIHNLDAVDDEPLDLEEFGGISVEEMEPVDDLEELTDLDLDTAADSLDDLDDLDSGIPDGFGDLSIEDEVLEDDFGSLDDDDSDEFSLGDFGDSFNFDKESASTSLSLDELTKEAEEEPVEEELKFTPEEFEAIQQTMAGLPLNLKIVIEEEISENGLFGVKLEGLVELLIDEAPLKEILRYVNKKLGHNIKISSSFQKISALDFEKQKERFSYIFIHSVLPKLRWVFPIGAAASLLYLAGYFWGYKIIKSENIYKRGHELILVDKYEEAYDEFLEAFNVHRKMNWYHTYADTYRERKAYPYAEKIYLQIINEDSSDKDAILNYARMKGFEEADYASATYFLNSYIERGVDSYPLMSTLGDLYMKWAEIDPSHYEDARLWYAETMNRYGPKPPILFKYLNYFIAIDNLQEVKNYRRMFEISEDVKVDGDIYARMAGYLMDRGIVENVMETIFRGLNDNPRNPNLHYQLARYFESTGDYREVEKAARNAIFYYEYGGHLDGDELESLVDAKHILGNLYTYEERYLSAEKNYKEAVSLYENLRNRSYVDKDEKFGKIYASYGDIFYYAGNSYNSAYNLYEKAEENKFSNPELSYKKGFINYTDSDMEGALSEFHDAENLVGRNDTLLFAKANTLSHRGSYNSALTYYYILLEHLERQEEDEERLYPAENDSHLAIVENFIKVYNNIGVTLFKLEGESALAEVGHMFTQSQEKYDYLTRDPELLIRSDLKDLAYYNTRAILYPDMDIELMLYNSIPRDFNDLNLGIVTELK